MHESDDKTLVSKPPKTTQTKVDQFFFINMTKFSFYNKERMKSLLKKSPSYPNGFVNLAYTDQTAYDLSQFHDATVIDLCATPIQSVVIDNFPNLKRLRTQRCSNLTTLKVTNCPNL